MSVYDRGLAVVGQSGERTWPFTDFVKRLNDEHDRLAEAWKGMKTLAQARKLTREAMIEWNAVVYVQQGLELQCAAPLRDRAGGTMERKAPLGVFSGLPGGGVAHAADPRFQVPRVTVTGERAVLGAIPALLIMIGPTIVKVGAWLVVGIAGLAALLGALRITGVLGGIERHYERANYLENYVKAGGKLAPPKPPPSEGIGVGTVLVVGGLAAGAAIVVPKLTKKAA